MSEQNDPAPSVQQVLGAAGAPATVRYKGKAYKLGHPTQAAKARLEELAADTAVARVEAMEGRVKPATFDKMVTHVTGRIERGEFNTWKPGWQEVVWDDGAALFALSLFREFHEDMSPEFARELVTGAGWQYRAALARVLPDFFDLLLAGRDDLTPEQSSLLRAELAALVARLTPAGPTPESTAPSSPNG